MSIPNDVLLIEIVVFLSRITNRSISVAKPATPMWVKIVIGVFSTCIATVQ